VVESGNKPLQAPVPPPPETVAALQLTWTAEIGIVGQPTKELDPACRLRVQFWRCEPLRAIQLKLPGEEPETIPESGLPAWKVIVPGVADRDPKVAIASLKRDGANRPAWRFPTQVSPVPQIRATRIYILLRISYVALMVNVAVEE
jgi:hypothetical protein